MSVTGFTLSFRPLAGNGLGKCVLAVLSLSKVTMVSVPLRGMGWERLEIISGDYVSCCFRPLAGNGLGKLVAALDSDGNGSSFRPLAGNGLGKTWI